MCTDNVEGKTALIEHDVGGSVPYDDQATIQNGSSNHKYFRSRQSERRSRSNWQGK